MSDVCPRSCALLSLVGVGRCLVGCGPWECLVAGGWGLELAGSAGDWCLTAEAVQAIFDDVLT